MIIKRSYNDSESVNKENSKTVVSRLYIFFRRFLIYILNNIRIYITRASYNCVLTEIS